MAMNFTPNIRHSMILVCRKRLVRLFDMFNGGVNGVGSAFLIVTTSFVEHLKVHDWVLDTAPAGYRFTEVQMLLRSGQGVPN